MRVWSFAAVYGLAFGALGLGLGVNMAAAPKAKFADTTYKALYTERAKFRDL